MIKSVRHLRADENGWLANDIVIPDGEIAILKTKGGRARIKVGNGIDKFSALPSLGTDAVKENGTGALILGHGKSYRLGQVQSLALSIPPEIDDDYYSEVSFDSGTDATELEIIGRIRLSGDDVADEELMPKANTHYTVFVWYDGELQGIVRGLPNA
jgi:hypothetical protein